MKARLGSSTAGWEPGWARQAVSGRLSGWRRLLGMTVVLIAPLMGAWSCGGDRCHDGDEGCDCYPNGTCNGDFVCSQGVCQSPLCDVGSLGCACEKNFTCDPGLECVPDPQGPYCDEACPAGELSCACLPGDRCQDPGNECRGGICDSPDCPVGTRNCHCLADRSCGPDLVCIGETCLDSDAPVEPPKDPKCYTPCSFDLELGGGAVRACSPEGLMEGCVGDQVCINGSCLSSKHKDGDQSPRSCAGDSDCPDFQTCIAGGCYSNCEQDNDCPDGRQCHRHVCRRICSVNEDSCPQGDHCESLDGDTGVCMPQVAPDGDQDAVVEGSFELSETSLTFSNVQVQSSLTVTNNSSQTLEFTITKVSHTYVDEMGVHNVTDGGALAWMSIGEFGRASQAHQTSFLVEGNGGTKRIVFLDAAAGDIEQWTAVVEISNRSIGTQKVHLSYSEVPEGKWKGQVYYFSNFGDENIDDWIAVKDTPIDADAYQSILARVGNAFIQKWGMFRKGWLTYGEITAALNATVSGSWAWQSTQDVCPWPAGACFLYDNPNGYVEYTSNRYVVPVPSGVVSLPIAMNLRPDPQAADSRAYSGKIVSDDSLHLLGDPAVQVRFASDPGEADSCTATSNDGACILTVTDVFSTSYVGGRLWRNSANESCPSGDYRATKIPWLVPGFVVHTGLEGGERYAYECRTQTAPFGSSSTGEDRTDANVNLAGANPVPNGRILVRTLELVDGALVNRKQLLLIFREHFVVELGRGQRAPFDSYGVMVLTRQPENLSDEDYEGWSVTAPPVAPEDRLNAVCSQRVIDAVLGNEDLSAATVGRLARGIITGKRSEQQGAILSPDGVEQVHYYCEDTGQIDGAPSGSDLSIKTSCPWGSKVRYFTVRTQTDSGGTREDCTAQAIADLSCQSRGTCQDLLNLWQANGTCDIRMDPLWSCSEEGQVYCDDDRLDLRDGKVFYADTEDAPVYLPIQVSIDEAFRYKVRFQSRQGQNVGFTPAICQPDSNATPYCYDPGRIEEIQERVDCALSLFTDYYDDLSSSERTLLHDYLVLNFSRDEDNGHDGFERLDSELLIMLGDEAFTSAFSSRFDLAGQAAHSFQGSLFEPDGMDLSGQAGYELYSLYQAVEYYQIALDRFYRFSPYLWESISRASSQPERNFVTQQTVTEYLDRLIRASTQKSRALSEIAKRYQSFNRPDLARIVVQRAYGAAYIESAILSHLMLKVIEVSSPTLRGQIRQLVDKASRTYQTALLDMRDVYAGISESANSFGFAPDYIPFPALDPGDTNAFSKMLAIANQKLAVALDKENTALATTREYETDQASFQAELLKIQQEYENQLSDLCGTFQGQDGKVYPAIPKYAHLHPIGKLLGNPCGLVGNGKIHEDMADYKIAATDLQIAIANYEAKLEQIEIERQRVESYCDAVVDYADMMLRRGEHQESLLLKKKRWQTVANTAKLAMDAAAQKVTAADCIVIVGLSNGTNCPQKGLAYAAWWAVRIVSLATMVNAKRHISSIEADMRAYDRQTAYLQTVQDCVYARIDSQAKIATLATETEALALEMAKAHYGLLKVAARIEGDQNNAQRLIAQESDAEEMAIDVAAAHNDPNVRIYKNDAIITADMTFQSALKAAYKATKVFEYYTSESYAPLMELPLVRMAGHGDKSLESYLGNLQDAYLAFQESYGNPDARVAVLSLRDDILKIPRVDDDYQAISEAARTKLLREKLADPKLRDAHGYIVIPFNTALRALSPLTRNHKITYVEAELVGTDLGDLQGRVYLRQRGTGVVRGLDGTMQYYGFPERTAVINTFFNGNRFFVFSDDDVFKSFRLRDRPLVNTRWELLFNPVDEQVNQDINLNGLSDIRLYIYYRDFTAL